MERQLLVRELIGKSMKTSVTLLKVMVSSVQNKNNQRQKADKELMENHIEPVNV